MYKKILVLLLIFTLFLQWNGPVGAVNDTQLESISSSGNQSNGFSYESMVSGNGRYVVFSSDANNLVNGDNNGITDVYIRDLEHNNTECISRSSSGSLIGGYAPSISGDGRYVTFTSMESGISSSQIFLRDRILNITKIISLNNVGDAADGDCGDSAISGDGRFVAFTSWASNLVSSDSNGLSDIFIRDMILNTTKLVSISANGQQGNFESYTPSISFNGQFIAFVSSANNLVNNDNNGVEDIFVKDIVSGVIKIASLNNNGEQTNSYSSSPSISNDGTRVAFSSMANNLVDGDNNSRRDVFVRDLVYNITKRASESSLGEEVRMESSNPVISGDGRYVAFESGNRPPQVSAASPGHGWIYSTPKNQISQASALVPGDIINSKDIFVKDLFTGDINKISWSINGSEANADSYEPSINYNGSVVSFTSWASDMTNNDYNELGDIFAHGVTVSNPEFKLNGYLTPLKLKAGQWVKVIASTSYPAKSVVALIKGVKINLSFLNGHWEGSYKVPAGEKVGKQKVNLMAYSSLANDSCLLSFNVISTPVKPSNSVIKPVVKPVIKNNNKIINSVLSRLKSVQNPKTGSTIAKKIPLNLGIKADSTIKKVKNYPGVSEYYYDAFITKTNITKDPLKAYMFMINSIGPGGPLMGLFKSYTSIKINEASNKALKSGNFWDFWDYTFLHIYGYSNLDKTWGGGNIKWILDGLAGVDEHGNVSVGNFLINLIAIIPIARLATGGGKYLARILPKSLKNNKLLSNLLKALQNNEKYVQLKKSSDLLLKKLHLNNRNIKDLVSGVGNVLFPGVSTLVDVLAKFVSRVTVKSKNVVLDYLNKGLKSFSDYQFRRSIVNDWGGFFKAPNKTKYVTNKVNAFKNVLVKNIKYVAKKTIKGAYKALKPYIPKKITNRLDKEYKEYKKKGKRGYVKSKYHQVQKKWNKAKRKVKSFNKKYVKPVLHKYLDPIRKTKTYKKIRNLPVVKQVLDFGSKVAKKWHLW